MASAHAQTQHAHQAATAAAQCPPTTQLTAGAIHAAGSSGVGSAWQSCAAIATAERGAFSGAPPEAGEIDLAAMWWYCDSSGAEQGPYPVDLMRSWLTAGYFDAATHVAASYYGEVPSQMWPLSQLWADPAAQAFVLAAGADAPPPTTAAALEEYMPSDAFEGARAGYVFKNAHYGVGYYRDEPQPIEVTAESLLKAEQANKRKRKANNTFGLGKLDAWSD